MFMRNRAHICNYCCTIDEAHYKRHRDLVEQLRSIYESCGEADWTIVPVEPGDPRWSRSSDAQTSEGETSDRSITPEETPASKRERKDAKCLARAANRTKVATQEEIKYVDSVLHSSEGVANGDGASPANVEEVWLIEEHLRYNANVYNSSTSRKALKRFAKIPEVDVDFENEVERVLETFRIAELVTRNFRNRGLQGKELKTFENLVEAFRNTVVEDLVLVEKDMMEISMRRAGYLRYTNKNTYRIVEDRYAEKDWKTGERIMSSASESSSLSSPSDGLIPSQSNIHDPPNLDRSVTPAPDCRHLQHIHTRVNGDDGLSQRVIEPYNAPLLPLAPSTVLRKPAILQLKVTENRENNIPAGKTNRGWLRRDRSRHIRFVQRQSMTEVDKLPPSPSLVEISTSETPKTPIKPAWGKIPNIRSPGPMYPKVDERHFPSLDLTANKASSSPSDALAVQPPAQNVTTSLQGPERLIVPFEDNDTWHPIVSQRRRRKHSAKQDAKPRR
ncbi:hypothetical protein E8E12_005444 [Didymella heteroderae]|uniref:Uncharacterized protein n=1 Tax=Didymella heteroderae TaxID=1769908 RepID=A0A9P5C3T0_9PLEO|nr:hypothetical protein E8E12_005444 [Didymella heteroderae]